MLSWRRAPELVGRADELAVLTSAVSAAATGHRSVVLVGGEAGAGKTRLVNAAAAGSAGRVELLAGSCLGYADGSLPFAPVLAALSGWAQSRPSGAGSLADLEVAAPGILDLVAGAGGQLQAYGTVAAAISTIAAGRPVMLIIDDLQWADRTTLEFLDYLASRSERQHLALVGTFRDNEIEGTDLGRWLAEMIRCRGAAELHLAPLTGEQSEVLAEQVRGRPLDPGEAAEVHRRSGGNSYLVELLAQPEGGAVTAVPAGLTQALLARWHELSDADTEILLLLAVYGRPIDRQVLAAVVGSARGSGVASAAGLAAGAMADTKVEDLIDDALDEGVRRGVISHTAEGEFGFRHPLLGEIVVGTLPPGRLRRCHRAVAAVISALPGLPEGLRATDMAVHCAAAGDDAGALRWSWHSAVRAQAVHGFAEASDHLGRLLERWDRVDDPAGIIGVTKADLLLKAVEVAVMCGRSDQLVPMARAAAKAVDSRAEPVRAGGLRVELFHSLCLAVQDPLVEELARDAIALTKGSSGSERAGALGIEALFAGMGGDRAEAGAISEQSVRMARTAGDSRILARCLVFRGSGRVLHGRDGARHDLMEGIALARSVGSMLDVSHGHVWVATLQSRDGDHDEAIATLLAGWQECRESRLDRGLGFQMLSYAVRLMRERGRWVEAAQVLAEMRAVRTEGVTRLKLLLEEAQLQARLGRLDRAREVLRAAGDVARLPFLQFAIPDHQLAEVEVATWGGRPHDVLTHARAGLTAIVEQDCGGRLLVAAARGVADLAVAARDRGADDPAVSAGMIHELTELRGRLRVDPFGSEAPKGWEPEALKATWDAELSRIAGADGAELWLWAEDLWQGRGFLPDAAYAAVRAAESMIGTGRVREAAAPLRRGHEVATQIGARPLADLATAAAAASRIRLDQPQLIPVTVAPSPLNRLTVREREILALVAAGRTNTEIGQQLFISATTASVHVSNILRKLEVPDRYAAAAMAQRLAVT